MLQVRQNPVAHRPKLADWEYAGGHKSFLDVQDALESEESEVEDVEEQPSLDMTSLQAIGEYFVTSRAFSQYKQRLHQFLHPIHDRVNHPSKLGGAQCDQEVHRMDVSRELEPEANIFVETGKEHSLGDQKENRRAQRPGKTRNNSTFVNSGQPLANFSHIEGRRMPWERDSFATWVAKWATDTLWPPSNGSKRMWYFCVSSSFECCSKIPLTSPLQFLGVRPVHLYRCQGA